MARTLNFDGTSRRIPVKSLDVGDRLVTIAPRIEVDQMETLGLPHYGYKNLPISRIATEFVNKERAQEKPIVLVKGTIVSLLTDQTVVTDGMVNPAASGTIPGYAEVGTDSLPTGSIVDYSIDDSYFGYDDDVVSLLVPANGGAQSTLSYTALDTSLNPYKSEGDSDLTLAANLPAGIVYHDVYLDERGAHLNYELQDAVGVACAGMIWLPCVDIDKVNNNIASGGKAFGNAAGIANATTNAGYNAVYKKVAFAAFDSNSNEGVSGAYLKSDLFGRFVYEGVAAPTSQTVGKVVATDSRYPKEIMDEIRTYPGLQTPNVKTAGIPTDLYVFVKDVMTAVDSTPSATDIRDAIRSGAFGYMRIKLSV